jgi:hypothetical protein
MRTSTIAYSLAAAGLLLISTPRLFSRPEESLDPLKVASDTHKLLFENKLIRVIEAKVPVGSKEPKHSHPHGLTVYLANYDIEQKSFPDGKVSRSHRAFGTVSWGEATVHEITNVGKTKSHSIRIELK